MYDEDEDEFDHDDLLDSEEFSTQLLCVGMGMLLCVWLLFLIFV